VTRYPLRATVAHKLARFDGSGWTSIGTFSSTAVIVAGSSRYPAPSQFSVSVRGVVPPGSTRAYQAWFRNAVAFCQPETFNWTAGLSVAWSG
jgi:hypothetical protein